MSISIIVTGAYGFVGRRLVELARARGYSPVAPSISPPSNTSRNSQESLRLDAPIEEWAASMLGGSSVIHLAARAHVMGDSGKGSIDQYRAVNVEGTVKVARAAILAGVRRFVFVSSSGVYGISSDGRGPFNEDDVPAPLSAYGQSKLEAELALRALSDSSGLEVVIIRPPLVYGPGVKGNLRLLMDAIRVGVPLPFGRVNNRRTLVGVHNLADALLLAATSGRIAGGTFQVSDGVDISTRDLCRALAEGMERPCRLWSCPPAFLRLAANLVRRETIYLQLCGSMCMESDLFARTTGWVPRFPQREGLLEMAADYLRNQ